VWLVSKCRFSTKVGELLIAADACILVCLFIIPLQLLIDSECSMTIAVNVSTKTQETRRQKQHLTSCHVVRLIYRQSVVN